MAKDSSNSQLQSARSRLMRLALMVLVGLIFLLGLVVLIVWLVLHPKKLQYSVEDAYITDYHLSGNHVNATYNFHVQAHNKNKRISVYYDSAEVRVEYDEQIVATDVIDPFIQPKRNVTDLYLKLESKDAALSRHAVRTLRLERTAGSVQLDLKIKARVRFRLGAWKSKDRTMKIYCNQVVANWAAGRSFERKHCDASF
ncbi:hypothetical protein MLD38_040184 [Melastoma candidum]|uniref:Uncharacterized protein n=1 Tax=Melastoma candidum TaxID=119954 RepID=A0ACB9L5W1_9MYRT|nr:hypothetical protein MLD38_040184 [Melastoma candidum]